MIDNYAWLRDKNDPEVRKYIEQENIYTDEVTSSTEKAQAILFQELKVGFT